MGKKTLSKIREKLGMVFQDPDDQLFMTTVYDDVAFGPRNYNLQEDEVERRVMKALNLVGIPHLKDRAPFKLSGGEKRRIMLARAIIRKKDVLILDEPLANLDKNNAHLIEDLILKINDVTLIVISHTFSEEKLKEFLY